VTYVKRSALALTRDELDEFLRAKRWGRLATTSLELEPHITPLGYAYHDGAIWFHALREGRRARDLADNPKVAFLVDDGVAPGDSYRKRRGVIAYGRCVVADDDPVLLDEARYEYMRAFDATSVDQIQRRTHSWYRIDVERTSSWDFRKIPQGADRTLEREAAARREE
jgi:nitroimidazol reductase NimA-like FMN-containing flavoprotein (pyridoxamine 5'-phosphate oxidase superfamily)